MNMKAVYLRLFLGISCLGSFSLVCSAPLNITATTDTHDGFMETMYHKLLALNSPMWIFPPKEDLVNKTALLKQVDDLCQSSKDPTEDNYLPIQDVCAGMLYSIFKVWKTPGIEKQMESIKTKINLPSKLDDLYKEEELGNTNASEFCRHFSQSLNKEDFNPLLSPFVEKFVKPGNSSGESCEIVCRNGENKSVIYLGQVNIVCAMFWKAYNIQKLVPTEEKYVDPVSESGKPLPKPNVQVPIAVNDAETEGHAKETGNTVESNADSATSTKKRMEFVAPETNRPVSGSSMKNTGDKQLPVHSETEESKTPSVKETKPEEKVAEKGDAKGNDEKGDTVVNYVLNNGHGAVSSSSSTQSSAVVPDNQDLPPPPISGKTVSSSSPKTVEKIKNNSPDAKPPSNSPDGSLPKVEQQNQNEAPPDAADYDDGVPPPGANDKPSPAYDNDDDSTALLDAMDVNGPNKKPSKAQDSLSVSLSKEKQGDIEVGKVSIAGDSATVNVAFNEQSDPGVINYFVCFLGLLAILYLLFHNKKRLIAYVVEGRRPQSGRRRSSSTQYRKLENNFD